jgi:hypothetical protein
VNFGLHPHSGRISHKNISIRRLMITPADSGDLVAYRPLILWMGILPELCGKYASNGQEDQDYQTLKTPHDPAKM